MNVPKQRRNESGASNISNSLQQSGTKKTTFSVMLLCWNHVRYVEACVTALAAQDDRDFDVVFLDNCSSDGSFALAERLFIRHGLKATLLQNDRPQSIAANANRLLANADGELVSLLSTDDYYHPSFVSAMRRAASDHPDALWFFGEREELDERTNTAHMVRGFVDGDVKQHLQRVIWPINMVGVCYRREALKELGGWDEQIAVEDTDMMFRLAQAGSCVYIRQPLVTYRVHEGAISRKRDFVNRGWEDFIGKHGKGFPARGRKLLGEVYRVSAALNLDEGDIANAGRHLRSSFAAWPFDPSLYRTGLYWLRRRLIGS